MRHAARRVKAVLISAGSRTEHAVRVECAIGTGRANESGEGRREGRREVIQTEMGKRGGREETSARGVARADL
jgi:hypothetical protein